MSRTPLTAPLTINVPLPGDTGNGTLANPYSIQPAWDMLFQDYDLRGFPVTIQLQTGTQANPVFYKALNIGGRIPGQAGMDMRMKTAPNFPDFRIGNSGRVTLRGNPTNPWGAFIYDQTDDYGALTLVEGASLWVDGIGMITKTQDCVDVFYGAFLCMQNIVFGNAGPVVNAYSNHISCAMGGTVFITGKVTVCGWAASFANVGSGGYLYWNTNGDYGIPIDFELIGTPNFPRGFLLVTDGGAAFPFAVNFIGTAIGPRYRVMRNGVIVTANANPNYLPGNTIIPPESGGIYA